jgi:hypothetical protein
LKNHAQGRTKLAVIFPLIGFRNSTFIFLCILIVALLFDQGIVRIYSYAANPHESDLRLTIFILIGCISVVGQYVLLALIGSRISRTNTGQPLIRMPQIWVAISQFLLIALLAVIILDIILFSYYPTVILQAVIMVSYGLSIVSFTFLSAHMIKWFYSKRSYLVLLYAISSSLFVLSFIFLLLFLGYTISNFPAQIQLHHHNLPYFNNPGSPTFITYNSYIYLSIISFIITWLATAAVLLGYSKKMGKTKYWLVVSLPLIYFLSQFVTLFGNFLSLWIGPDPIFYGITLPLIFTLSRSVGGIFFGLAFWMMSRTLRKSTVLRDYLRITSIGFMLLFVSDQGIALIFVPYPPFGLSSVMVVGLAAYFVSVGLYYSAISIANDMSLRKYIYASALKELSMLGSMGMAKSEEQIGKVVSQILSKHQDLMVKEIASPSIEDVKDYTEYVLEELKKHRIK